MGVLYVEHANVLELCYIELLSGDGSPYSILSAWMSRVCSNPHYAYRPNSYVSLKGCFLIGELFCNRFHIATRKLDCGNYSYFCVV